MRRTPRICVGIAELWDVAASSTHKHGLPRLCVGHLIFVRAEFFFHAYALLRRMCVALKMLGRSLPSTHMRAVLGICVVLGRASSAGSRLLLQNVTRNVIKVAFHAYAWVFGCLEPCLSNSDLTC
ncbi:hypothetical protein PIB30_079439 [Stylosanthes scabra]|uniref:Secreted protein n=1 Tax=Stylosanthes scabra TaxID=79078 RepID=A0ABU6VT56_9FABA|nr:hypothetical protein [Stylosanthes scabra]